MLLELPVDQLVCLRRFLEVNLVILDLGLDHKRGLLAVLRIQTRLELSQSRRRGHLADIPSQDRPGRSRVVLDPILGRKGHSTRRILD
jgi:hypothetical protein